MLDFILGMSLAGLLVRGWGRGFVREILDLVGLVVGIWIAFRLSGPLGEFLTDRFAMSPEVATVGAGVALFLLFGVSLSIAAHYLSGVMGLPGLSLINNAGGAVTALGWGTALILVLVNIVRVLPIAAAWDETLGDSTVVEAIAGPDAFPQTMFNSVVADNPLGYLQSLQSVLGAARAVPEGYEVLRIPAAPSDEVRQVREEASRVLGWVNAFRAGEGLGGLDSSAVLTDVAEDRALAMYGNGRLSREHPPGDSVAGDLAGAGVRLAAAGENLALASSARAAFDGMRDSATGLDQLITVGYDRAGVAVVDGPTGRLVVIVFGG
jgi:membrane protein required for colicin V production